MLELRQPFANGFYQFLIKRHATFIAKFPITTHAF
jgi:hypothetical protein